MKDLQGRLKESGKPTSQADVNAVGRQHRGVRVGVRSAIREGRRGGLRRAGSRGAPGRGRAIDAARAAIARAVSAPGADAAAKAAALTTGVRVLARQFRQPGVLDQAESWVDELENCRRPSCGSA